ncbi:MAG: hypothetical protein Q8902_13240 [Bacteroidota bacterium]|nr:hypothetical protein [Bacteroidota bacterium]MDP4234141.1 hypothetical protein [Bacteroidota bacterium]MDP4244078.1 hypothetical protein [Bacteroidota bacterium]
MLRGLLIASVSIFVVSLYLAIGSSVYAQERTLTVTLHSAADSALVLPDNFPDFSSLHVRLDASQLRSGEDYRIDTLHRSLFLAQSFRSVLFPANSQSSATVNLTVSYYALPIELPLDFSRHGLDQTRASDSLRALFDTTGRAPRRITTVEPAESHADILNNFQKSGSISRGFQAGSNRDLGLTSGFNLQFSGDVAKDVNITGALTEEQTPIQPEGTTQTLNEIDKVFIKIKATDHFTSTLGDFVLDMNSPTDPARLFQSNSPLGVTSGPDDAFKVFSQSTFDVVSRKLIGAEASAMFDPGSVTVAGASPRGQFTSNTFQGQEAYQGPYRLAGKAGERAIIIVAGTEHVYVDGTLQTRGEKNDYIIDYALGEIRFQPRRLITSDSRITIDFEYSTQQYSRSLLAANGKGELFDGAFQLSATYLREGDNPDAPLDLTLSDSDRALLARAGTNLDLAAKSAVTLAGVSPTGHALGSYVRVDTVTDSGRAIMYRYDPFDTVKAVYNVSFGYAGTNQGAYSRLSIGQYQYVGHGHGDYDTLSFLPLPELHQVMAMSGNLRVSKNFGLTGEFATSALDPNRFAALPSITDNAYRAGALFADTLPLLGYTELKGTQRFIGRQFTPIDRIQDVEFERRYGDDAASATTFTQLAPTSELNREASLRMHPLRPLLLEGGYGALKHRELEFASTRLYGHAEVYEDTGFLPHISASIEHLPTYDSSQHEQALWNRLSGELSKTLRIGSNALTLGGRYGRESKVATPFESPALPTDSLTGRSFRYETLGPLAQLHLGNLLTIGGEYTTRTEDSARFGQFVPISDAKTTRATASLANLAGFSSTLDVTWRDKRYTDSIAKVVNGGDQSTLLLRFEPRYAMASQGLSADVLYEISNERTARMERIFLPVQKGLGGYYYVGDLNNNGRPDPEEFAPARYTDQGDFILITIPTEQLFPTTDLRSSFRLRVAPREMFHLRTDSSLWASFVGAVSSESYLRIEETSRDPDPNDIYFFRLSHFQNDSTTISGLLEAEQDFNILENDPGQSYRLHYRERRSASQYNTGLERTFLAERSIRARFRPFFELSSETTLTSTTDEATSDTLSVVRPHSTSQLAVTSDISYHPVGSALDYGARIELSRAIEHSFSPELTAFADAVTLRSSYALETRARLRGEIERDELTLSELPSDVLTLPYSLTNGRSLGTTWLWKLALDYQFGSGIIATLSYDGRNEAGGLLSTAGERVTVHNARAEVRANF